MFDLIAVCCTRGMVVTKTVESMDANLELFSGTSKKLWESDKKIPDAQNCIIQRALSFEPTYIWMVEEDIEPPATFVRDAIGYCQQTQAKVVAAKFNMDIRTPAYRVINDSILRWSGLGCILFDTSIFTSLKYPWFETDVIYSFIPHNNELRVRRNTSNRVYGRLDVNLHAKLRHVGIQAHLLPVQCPHWKVKSWGTYKTNDGCHDLFAI